MFGKNYIDIPTGRYYKAYQLVRMVINERY
jgi:hypothetical protein